MILVLLSCVADRRMTRCDLESFAEGWIEDLQRNVLQQGANSNASSHRFFNLLMTRMHQLGQIKAMVQENWEPFMQALTADLGR